MGDRLDQLDYYTLLSIEPGATADAVRDAFHVFARRYHPDRFAGAPPEKRARAAEIYRRGAEGYRVLLDPQARTAYDEGLQRGRLRFDATEARRDSFRPTSTNRLTVKSPRARPFATKASQALKKGDLQTAKLNLRMALQHEPDNALLKARLEDVEQRLAKG